MCKSAATWRMRDAREQPEAGGDVIEGATVIPNTNGSAPGQWLDTTFNGYRKLIMLIPGPPHECRPLFDEECVPRLREVLPPRHIATRTLKAAMIPESQADKLLAPIYTTYPDVETTILAHAGDIQLSLICSKASQEAAEQRVGELAGRLEEALDDWLYSSLKAQSLEQIVLYYAQPAPGHFGRGGELHGRHGCAAHHIRAGQLALLSGRSGRLLRPAEDFVCQRPAGTHRQARGRLVRSGIGARRGHPQTNRRDLFGLGGLRELPDRPVERQISRSASSISRFPMRRRQIRSTVLFAATANASGIGPRSRRSTSFDGN